MVIALVTGAVFPGAVPIEFEGFLKRIECLFWGLGVVCVGGQAGGHWARSG